MVTGTGDWNLLAAPYTFSPSLSRPETVNTNNGQRMPYSWTSFTVQSNESKLVTMKPLPLRLK